MSSGPQPLPPSADVPSPKAAAAAASAAARAAKAASADAGERSARQARWCLGSLLAFLACGAALSLYLVVFPDEPRTLSLSDARGLEALFYGGSPHVALCAADAAAPHISRIFSAARPLLRAAGVETVIVDCAGPLPSSGRSIASKFGLSGARPVWWLSSGGRRPAALPTSLASGGALAAEVEARLSRELRVTALTNTIDLERCVKDKGGGCLIAVSARPRAALEAELAPAAAAQRTLRFATLPAATLTLRTRAGGADGGAAALLNAATRAARAAAAEAGAPRGELLLHLRRDKAGAGLLLTAGQVAAPGRGITLHDVQALLATSARAAAVAAAAAGGGGSDAAAVAERLLSRDDDLADASSVLMPPSTLYVARAKVAAKPTPPPQRQQRQQQRRRAPAEEEGEEDEDEAAAAAEDESAAAAAAAKEEEEDPAAAAARAAARTAARRAAMAREEEESGYVAHLGGDDEEGDEGGAARDDAAAAAAVIDLDDDAAADHEEL